MTRVAPVRRRIAPAVTALLLVLPAVAGHAGPAGEPARMSVEAGAHGTRIVQDSGPASAPLPSSAPASAMTVWSVDDPTAIANSLALDGNSVHGGWYLTGARLSAYPLQGDGTPAFEYAAYENGSTSVAAARDADRIVLMEANAARTEHRLHGFTSASDGNPDWTFPFPVQSAGDSLDGRRVAVSRDGQIAVAITQINSTDESTLHVFDAQTGDVTRTWDDTVKIWGVDLSDDGSLALLSQTGLATLVNTATGETIFQAANSTGSNVVHHRLSGDGGVIVLGGVNLLRVYVREDGEYEPVIEFAGPSAYSFGWSVAVSRDGSAVGALGYSISLAIEAEVFMFDVASATMLGSYPVSGSGQLFGWGNGAASSDDGSVMAFASWGTEFQDWPEIMVFNRDVELIGEISFPGSAFSVDVSPDGRYVVGGSKGVHANQQGNAGRITLIDLQADVFPTIDVAPTALNLEATAGEAATGTLSIGNVGTADLEWSIDQTDVLTTAPTAMRVVPAAPPAIVFDPGHHVDEYGHHPAGVSPADTQAAPRGGSSTYGAATWSLLGPPGGDVFDIAASPVDPDIVLAGVAPNGVSGGTLYRSTDGGDTWAEVATMAGTSVLSIAFAPDGTVYIGTISSVWRSTDHGLTWDSLSLGIGPNNQVHEVVLDPTDPDTLWVSVADHQGSQAANLLRSTNAGQSWVDRTPPLSSPLSGRGVALDPADPDTAVAVFGGAFGGGQVWVTTDGGDTWTNRSAGLPDNPMRAVAFDGSRILVGGGQVFNSQHVGLYQSLDMGATWQALHDANWEVPVVNAIAIDPNDTQTLLVATDRTGVHRSTDGGSTWEITLPGTEALVGRSLGFHPGDPATVFLGTSSLAVFRSTDGGDTFVSSADGFSELNLFSIAASPLAPDELAVAFQGQNDGGVYTSLDGGQTWFLEPLPPTRYNTVAFAPDGTLHALSDGPTSIAPQGLYRRQMDGSWTRLGPELTGDPGLAHFNLGVMRFGSHNPRLILLGGSDSGVLGNEGAIWQSLDDGATWTRAYESEPAGVIQRVTDIEIVADGGEQHVLAVHTSLNTQEGGVLRSTDGGATWAPSNSGLPGGFFRDPKLCASAGDPQQLYLSAWANLFSTVLYSSTDGGLNWLATGWTGGSTSGDLVCDPVDAQTLYISLATAGSRVVRSEDGGLTFQPFGGGLDDISASRQLAFAGTSRLLLASDGGSFAAELGEARACANPVDVPWLSVAPDSGTTPPGMVSDVEVTADAAGLAPGVHVASLCIESNDAVRPVLSIPVHLTVLSDMPGELAVTPAALDFGQVPVGTVANLSLEVSNIADPGAQALALSVLEVVAGMPEFAREGGDCAPDMVLQPGSACTAEFSFSPAAEGAFSGEVMVETTDGQEVSMALSGEGVEPEPPVDEIFEDRFELKP